MVDEMDRRLAVLGGAKPANDTQFNSFRVRTTHDDGKITTVVDLLKANEMMARISTEIVDTKEEHTRLALLELGWTPPGAVTVDPEAMYDE